MGGTWAGAWTGWRAGGDEAGGPLDDGVGPVELAGAPAGPTTGATLGLGATRGVVSLRAGSRMSTGWFRFEYASVMSTAPIIGSPPGSIDGTRTVRISRSWRTIRSCAPTQTSIVPRSDVSTSRTSRSSTDGRIGSSRPDRSRADV